MLSHNINPHRLSNNPVHPQVYQQVERSYDNKQISSKKEKYLNNNDPVLNKG